MLDCRKMKEIPCLKTTWATPKTQQPVNCLKLQKTYHLDYDDSPCNLTALEMTIKSYRSWMEQNVLLRICAWSGAYHTRTETRPWYSPQMQGMPEFVPHESVLRLTPFPLRIWQNWKCATPQERKLERKEKWKCPITNHRNDQIAAMRFAVVYNWLPPPWTRRISSY